MPTPYVPTPHMPTPTKGTSKVEFLGTSKQTSDTTGPAPWYSNVIAGVPGHLKADISHYWSRPLNKVGT